MTENTKTILIIDDEKKIRHVYGRLLSRAGYKILKASNAPDAKEMMVYEKIDLALLDINMAKVDGTVLYDVMALFHPDVKVIVSSVYPLEEQRQHIENADDYFDKTDGEAVLLEKVSALLNNTVQQQ